MSFQLQELRRPRAGLASAGDAPGARAWAPRGCALPEGGLGAAERARLGGCAPPGAKSIMVWSIL